MWSPETEDQAVRQYRFLLRTAPLDALEEGHVEALGQLTPTRRALVLKAVQEGLVAGLRLTPTQARPIAHLLIRGERRRPGDFLRSCESSTLTALSEGVVVSEPMFGLFAGYAAWDGVDPVVDEGVDDSGYAEGWRSSQQVRFNYKGLAGSDTPDHFGMGGGGGG